MTLKEKMIAIEQHYGSGQKAAAAARVTNVSWSRWKHGDYDTVKSRCPAIVDFLYAEIMRQSVIQM